jgi:hypothetical protein
VRKKYDINTWPPATNSFVSPKIFESIQSDACTLVTYFNGIFPAYYILAF